MSNAADPCTELLAQLVAIDSQNPELVENGAGEAEIARFCVGWLQQRGVDAWVEEIGNGRCNAVARVGSGSGPTLVLCAHLDTVSAAGMDAPFSPRIEDGRMYGRGAYDMKGGVAAILTAMAELASDPPPATVMAALVADEEYASAGAFHFVRHHTADACIVTEPSEGRLILAHKGFVWAEIRTTGTAAHGSRWQDGVSAVGRMGRVIAALEEFDARELRSRSHPLLGPASLHCSMVKGGSGWSTYAAECTLRVERRTLPGETPATVLDELRDVIRRAGEVVEIHEVLTRAPLECDRASSIVRAVSASAAQVCGREPQEAGVAYWMDAAVFAEAGAESVNYGPGGAGAHAAEEYVDLQSVRECAAVLVASARRYAAMHGDPTHAAAAVRNDG